MPEFITCYGCNREMDMSNGQVWPQGKNRQYKLCKPCSKKWHLFEAKQEEIFNKYDILKTKEINAAKPAIFGDKAQADADEIKAEQPNIDKNKGIKKEA